MSHGEQWIVPFNFFLIGATALLWAFTLPVWTTVCVAIPIALVLAYFASDKYGGMQIVLLVALGWFMATSGLAKQYRAAAESQTELNIGYVILQFVATIVLGAVSLFLMLMVVAALMLAGEWVVGRVRLLVWGGADKGPDGREQADDEDAIT